MINGFEEQTHDLTEDEMKVIPILVKGFKTLVGKEKAMTAGQIGDQIKEYHGTTVSGPRLRKMVNYIRINHMVPLLVASSKGYYVSDDQQEMLDYIQSLKDRAGAIQEVADSLTKQFKNQYM